LLVPSIKALITSPLIFNLFLPIVEESKILPKIKDFKKIDERIKSVNDSQLKSSLISFLKAYNEKNK